MLDEKGQTEWDKFVRIEEHTVVDDEDEGMFHVNFICAVSVT